MIETHYTIEEIQENRQKWLDALRSDKYIQTLRRMRSNDEKFCSMGVGCDVSKIYSWIQDLQMVWDDGYGKPINIPHRGIAWTYGGEFLIMPMKVREFYGLEPAWHFSTIMVELNDIAQHDFLKMAQKLERIFREYDAGNWQYHESNI